MGAANRRARRGPRRTHGRVLALGSALTIAQIAATCRAYRRRLGRTELCLDATVLESIDSAGIQWLLVAAQAARERGQRLRVRGAGALLQHAAAALGLETQLTSSMELCE